MDGGFPEGTHPCCTLCNTCLCYTTEQFDKQCNIIDSMAHTLTEDSTDIKLIVGVVRSEKLWAIQKWMHAQKHLNRSKMEDWIKRKIIDYQSTTT